MILIDNRTGSKELVAHFHHNDTQLVRLEFADFAFSGHGQHGSVVIGLERKTIGDMLQCMNDDRFTGHQLPGLVQNYDVVYLLLEGRYRPSPVNGVLQWELGAGYWKDAGHGAARLMYATFVQRLNSLVIPVGVHLWHTADPPETAWVVSALHTWWGRSWDSHKSFRGIHLAAPEYVALTPVSRLRKIAYCLPGIGYEKSKEVIKKFRTVKDMVDATPKDWESLPGIGPETARKIMEVLR